MDMIEELLLKYIMNVNFKFDGEIYRQISDVTMDSLSDPILADIFLAKLKNGPLIQQIDKFPF